MKKIMIAVAIVCAAVVSQGAQMLWTNGGGANFVDSSGVIQESGTFVLMYLGNGAEADWSLASAGNVRSTATLSYEDPLHGIIDPYNNVSKAYTLEEGKDKDGQWYGVMLQDGSDYKQLIDFTSGEALAARQLSGFGPDGQGNYNPSAQIPNFTFATANYTVESVPEPTSGLLLLLGVAGLALKRRRA